MLLTKKGLWKIIFAVICFFVTGSFCLFFGFVFVKMELDAKPLFILSALSYVNCPLVALWGLYAEGKGKYLDTGNRLLQREVRPTEFIRQYNDLKNSPELVINKPSIQLLQLVAISYDVMDDEENGLATLEEMISAANEKKKAYVMLIKVSFLYSYGRIGEADKLWCEIGTMKLNSFCRMLMDSVFKSDRAMAMGDYKTVEAYCLRVLSAVYPKHNNLSKLIHHYKLGEVYEKMQDTQRAAEHYRYCARYGSETAIRANAEAALERILADNAG